MNFANNQFLKSNIIRMHSVNHKNYMYGKCRGLLAQLWSASSVCQWSLLFFTYWYVFGLVFI